MSNEPDKDVSLEPIVIEQFKSLQAETMLRISEYHKLLFFKMASCGALFSYILTNKEFSVIGSFVPPLIAVMVDFLIVNNLCLIGVIGHYLRTEIEENHFPQELKGYETIIHKTGYFKTKPMTWLNDWSVIIGSTVVIYALTVVIILRPAPGQMPPITPGVIVAFGILFILFIVDCVYSYQILMKKRPADERLQTLNLDGIRFYFRKSTVDTEVLSAGYQEHRFFAPEYQVAKTDTIIDVGAHIGVFTLLAAKKASSGVVYAIEPAKDSFDILRKNVEENNFANVIPRNLALSDKTGKIKLYYGNENWEHNTLCPPGSKDRVESDDVDSFTLRDFLLDNKISRVNYMKMNVEGAEYDIILKSPIEVIQKINFWLVEYHKAGEHQGHELADWFAQCGFSVNSLSSKYSPGKGWITAKYIG